MKMRYSLSGIQWEMDGVLYGRFSVQLNNFRRNPMHASTPCLDKTSSISLYPVSYTEYSRLSYFHRYFNGRQISILVLWLSVQLPTASPCGRPGTWHPQKATSARLIIAGRPQFYPPAGPGSKFTPRHATRKRRKKKRRLQSTWHNKAAHQYQKKKSDWKSRSWDVRHTKHTQGVFSNDLVE